MSEKTYRVGQCVDIWITGDARTYSAQVMRVNGDGFPDRLQVEGWPILKPGDFIIKDFSNVR